MLQSLFCQRKIEPALTLLRATGASVLVLAGAMTMALAAPKPATPPAPSGTAGLKSADGKDVGTVTLTQTPSGVRLRLALKGLPPGEQQTDDPHARSSTRLALRAILGCSSSTALTSPSKTMRSLPASAMKRFPLARPIKVNPA